MFASVITLLEIEAGIVSLERRDASQGGILRRWFESSVLPSFEKHTLPVDAPVARQCAVFRGSHSCGLADALIAATAHVHQMAVVTRKVRDFEPLGVRVLNPWAS
jgi:predicted nucleic acid-binding protein